MRRCALLLAFALIALAPRAAAQADPCFRCDVMYATDCGTGLWAIDTTTRTSTYVGNLPSNFVDLAVTLDGRLIGVSGISLWQISACDASAFVIPGTASGNGLTGDVDTTDVFVQGPPLSRVDTTGVGTTTVIGGTLGPSPPQWCGGSAGDMAESPSDRLLRTVLSCTCTPFANRLQVVDPTTGDVVRDVGCLVDGLGTGYGSIFGIAYDSSTLWAADAAGQPRLLQVDENTGLVTPVPISGGYNCGYGLAARPCIIPPDPCSQPPDTDGDRVADSCDDCPFVFDPAQADGDADGVGDACDDCPLAPDPRQADSDLDTVGDACDDCPLNPDPAQSDSDADLVGDACDACPRDSNPVNLADFDCNGDGDTSDGGELAGEQCDVDRDGIGDPCDCLPEDASNPPLEPVVRIDVRKSVGGVEISWTRVTDAVGIDVYRGFVAPGIEFGDALQTIQCFGGGDVRTDRVEDTLRRPFGLFWYLASTYCTGMRDSLGTDSFGVPRWPAPFVRPPCPEPVRDADSDLWQDAEDDCPIVNDPLQADADGDFIGNSCDACPYAFDPTGRDGDVDGIGDACDCDRDGDGIENDGRDPLDAACAPSVVDNCPDVANPTQTDSDGDGRGDACDG